MANTDMMGIEDFLEAVEWQAHHAETNHAPCTARLIRALPKVRAGDTATGRRMAAWQGLTLKDALPLRFTGGLHHLLLTGEDDRLARVYSGQITDQGQIDRMVCDMVETHDHRLLAWLDGPPQTNEAGRGASLMGGILWLAQRVQPRFDLFELGASAGVNTMMERYHFRLGETEVGPAKSPMQIVPEWRGDTSPPAPGQDFVIEHVRGCDLAPIDLSDSDAALRLKAYVWPDAPGRLARIDAAVELASANPPDLVKCDAAEFVDEMLARPQSSGTTKALFHSIMWQYMPAAAQDRISEAMASAGARASVDKPLAWVALETDPATFRHALTVRYWDGSSVHATPHTLGFAHPHGAWVEWVGSD